MVELCRRCNRKFKNKRAINAHNYWVHREIKKGEDDIVEECFDLWDIND